MVPVTPALPATPKATPAWLIRFVSVLLPIVGGLVDRYNVLHITSPVAKALVLLGFLVVAGAIFLGRDLFDAWRAHGFSLATLRQVDEESKSELSALLDEARPLIATVKTSLPKTGELADLVSKTTAVAVRAEAAATKAEAVVPSADKSTALAALRELLDGTVPSTPPEAPAEAPMASAQQIVTAPAIAPSVVVVDDRPTIVRAQATAEGAPATAESWNGKRII